MKTNKFFAFVLSAFLSVSCALVSCQRSEEVAATLPAGRTHTDARLTTLLDKSFGEMTPQQHKAFKVEFRALSSQDYEKYRELEADRTLQSLKARATESDFPRLEAGIGLVRKFHRELNALALSRHGVPFNQVSDPDSYKLLDVVGVKPEYSVITTMLQVSEGAAAGGRTSADCLAKTCCTTTTFPYTTKYGAGTSRVGNIYRKIKSGQTDCDYEFAFYGQFTSINASADPGYNVLGFYNYSLSSRYVLSVNTTYALIGDRAIILYCGGDATRLKSCIFMGF
jgi:hypothetical protein